MTETFLLIIEARLAPRAKRRASGWHSTKKGGPYLQNGSESNSGQSEPRKMIVSRFF